MDGVKHNPWMVLVIVSCSIWLSLQFQLSLGQRAEADRITANQSLSGDQTITSADGDFRLGFFTPGNSSKYYIGMWYNKVPQRVYVWVANREISVSDRFASQLRISGHNLVLFNESNLPIWSTALISTNTTLGSVEAALLDDGNFVLRESSRSGNTSSSAKPLWQSFDHPADTWLPGGKIGYSKITGKNMLLTSWRNREDPAPGVFSLLLDPNGTRDYFIYYNLTHRYWDSGPWDENRRIFSRVPEMNLNSFYNFSFIDNTSESYFTYSMYNSSIYSRFVMDVAGQIQVQSWLAPAQQWNLFWSQPRVQCEVYAYCGSFGSCNTQSQPFCSCLTGFVPQSQGDWESGVYSGGCSRRTILSCGNTTLVNGPVDRFLEVNGVELPANAQSETVGSIGECQSNCLSHCSCSAYAYDGNQCSVWYGELLNMNQLVNGDPQANTVYVKLAASEFSSSKNNKGVAIGAVVGSVVLVMVFGIILLVILRRRKGGVETRTTVEGSLIVFTFKDLQNATNNFSEKLGGGGFGSVFKGTLSDASIIAVKKLENINQGEKQFRTEVSTIGTIQHVNLVRLRGFCSEGEKRMLVYDCMPNGSLDAHLFGYKSLKVLDWKTRYQVAMGIARGLTYLHEKCRDCIIHCDIKPENILLDAEYCPKVADFGLAKLVGRDFSRVLTTMRGTRGYLAPEWISGVAITAKADVYSYGMMLFELVSGKRNTEHSSEEAKVKFFPSWAASQLVEGGDVVSLVDPRLVGDADAEEVMRICKVACWCIQDEESQRPSMSLVVQILEGISTVNMPPIPRSLRVIGDSQEHIVFFTESSSIQSSQTESNGRTANSSNDENSNISSTT